MVESEKRISIPGGFLMVDLMIVILLMAIAIGPMINAFYPSLNAMASQRRTAVMTAWAQGTLNRLAMMDYDVLEAKVGNDASLVSFLGNQVAKEETLLFDGKKYLPKLVVTDYSGGSGGLIELTVTLDTIVFKTLKADF